MEEIFARHQRWGDRYGMKPTDKKTGLTLGKFAPLHKGHQLLLETALSEMDEVMAVIYDCPETTFVPLCVRANWIRKLYPSINVIEAWDGPTAVGDSPEIKQKHEDYILNELKISNITHFYSSEFYGEHMSRALGAVNRLVDCDRKIVPTAATAIRDHLYECRHYLHPLVYRDHVTNVALLGAPSTGKTALAEKLAAENKTVWMPEYGRQYWESHQIDRRLTRAQLVELAEGHLEREEQLLVKANQYLFTDTNAITTYIFSLYYHGAADAGLQQLAIKAATRYDLVLICDTDIPYDDTWDRSGDANRLALQKQILGELIARRIPFFTLRGNLEERARQVDRILSKYRKYQNILEVL